MVDVAKLFMSGEDELSKLMVTEIFVRKSVLELLDESDIVVTNPHFRYSVSILPH